MKKVWIGLLTIILIVGCYVYVYQFFYPDHPIESLSTKEILTALNNSNEDIVELVEEKDIVWFIAKNNGNNGIKDVNEKIKNMIYKKGWSFQEVIGSGLIFEKEGEKLIVTTQMWSSSYVLIQIPANYQ